MSNEHSSHPEPGGFWYTYFGKGVASAIIFLWLLIALSWIISVLNWG